MLGSPCSSICRGLTSLPLACIAMPLHTSRVRARIPSATSKSKLNNSPKTKGEVFASTKEDKRRIKHSSFVSRIEKPSQKTKKRRRPSKKLVANLESLGDALPDLDDPPHKNFSSTEGAVIRQRSLKSRPGALKKKAKLELLERDRFNRNMAQLAERPVAVGSQTVPDAAADTLPPRDSMTSWKALRSFIASTMDREASK